MVLSSIRKNVSDVDVHLEIEGANIIIIDILHFLNDPLTCHLITTVHYSLYTPRDQHGVQTLN